MVHRNGQGAGVRRDSGRAAFNAEGGKRSSRGDARGVSAMPCFEKEQPAAAAAAAVLPREGFSL